VKVYFWWEAGYFFIVVCDISTTVLGCLRHEARCFARQVLPRYHLK
jgi:hypothetical protein